MAFDTTEEYKNDTFSSDRYKSLQELRESLNRPNEVATKIVEDLKENYPDKIVDVQFPSEVYEDKPFNLELHPSYGGVNLPIIKEELSKIAEYLNAPVIIDSFGNNHADQSVGADIEDIISGKINPLDLDTERSYDVNSRMGWEAKLVSDTSKTHGKETGNALNRILNSNKLGRNAQSDLLYSAAKNLSRLMVDNKSFNPELFEALDTIKNTFDQSRKTYSDLSTEEKQEIVNDLVNGAKATLSSFGIKPISQ